MKCVALVLAAVVVAGLGCAANGDAEKNATETATVADAANEVVEKA